MYHILGLHGSLRADFPTSHLETLLQVTVRSNLEASSAFPQHPNSPMHYLCLDLTCSASTAPYRVSFPIIRYRHPKSGPHFLFHFYFQFVIALMRTPPDCRKDPRGSLHDAYMDTLLSPTLLAHWTITFRLVLA